jgi:hypothetical protein
MNVKPLGIAAALAILASSGFAQNTSGPLETPVYWRNILDTTLFSGKACTNYNTAYFNAITGDIVRCRNTAGFTTSLAGVWTTVSGGGGGSSVWGGITGTLSNQTDLQAALNAKQNTLTLPLSVANGGTGTTTPALVAGTGISITGTWPAQTITNTGGGGGGMSNPMTTTGDIIIGGSSGTPARLGAGTNNYVLTMTSGSPAWQPSAGGGGGSGIPSGTALPGTCTAGASFIKTNNNPNQQLYICSATDTWTQNMLLGGLGALTINGTTGALDIAPGVVPRLTAANPFSGRNSFSGPMDFIMTGTPPAGAASKLTLYANNDGSLHYVNFAGTDATLSTGAGFASPMTTQDDIIVGGASGTPARLAKGADSQVLGIDPGTHHLTYINQTGGGGGGGTPGGATNQIQYNSSGSFAGGNFCLYPATTVSGSPTPQDRLVYNTAGCASPGASAAMLGLEAQGSNAIISMRNIEPSNFTQMYFLNDDTNHAFQFGLGNSSASVPELVNKPFMYDGSAVGSKGVLWTEDTSGSTADFRIFGTTHVIPQSANPGCSTVDDSGKLWMDSSTSTTHHFKVCSWTSSAANWVTLF